MSQVITGLLIVVGLINILPVLGVLSADRLVQAYGVPVAAADLEILLRHRALLFGVLGGFILYAAFLPAFQPAAMTMAAISMVGFALLVWSVGGYNANLARVLAIDLVGIVCLAIAAGLSLATPSS